MASELQKRLGPGKGPWAGEYICKYRWYVKVAVEYMLQFYSTHTASRLIGCSQHYTWKVKNGKI